MPFRPMRRASATAWCANHVAELEDGWTVVTEDSSVCSHYEHTIVINENGLPELLSYPGFALTEEEE